MSSILKALKKVEEEKAARQGESADFARSLLRSEHRRRRSGSGALLGMLALLLAVIATLWWSGWRSAPTVQISERVEVLTYPEPTIVADPPVLPTAKEPQVPSVPPLPDAEVLEVVIAAPAIPRPVAPIAPIAPIAPAVVTDLPPAPVAATPVEIPPVQVPVIAQRQSVETAFPQLQLSGIAWQEEREARLAIIDDLPVMEGMMIDGLLVEEILRDRVRFSRDGKIFELRVD